jgi:hypothetical protein
MHLGNQQTCTSDNDNYIMVSPILNQIFDRCIIANLLTQHEFSCVNLIGRCWRACKKNHYNTHIPYNDFGGGGDGYGDDGHDGRMGLWLWWDGYGAADGPGGQDRGDACSQMSGHGDGCAPHHWSTCSAGRAMCRSNANEGIRNCFLLDSEGLNSSSVILWVSFGDNPRRCCFCGETFGWLVGWLGCRSMLSPFRDWQTVKEFFCLRCC